MLNRCFIVILTAISALLLAGCGDFLSEFHDPKPPAPLDPALLPEICQINPKGFCTDITMKHHRFIIPQHVLRVYSPENPSGYRGHVTTYKNANSFKFRCCGGEILKLIDFSNGKKFFRGKPTFEFYYVGDRHRSQIRETGFPTLYNMDLTGNGLESYNDDFWLLDIHAVSGFVLLSKEPLFKERQVTLRCIRIEYIRHGSVCEAYTVHALDPESTEITLSIYNGGLRSDDLQPCPDYNVERHSRLCQSFTVSEYIEKFPEFMKKIEALIAKLEVRKP